MGKKRKAASQPAAPPTALAAQPLPQTKAGPAGGRSVPVVPASSLTPERFWREYVSQRQPVVLDGQPGEAAWRATPQRWTDEYLLAAAGGVSVEVEVRGSAAEGYGRGTKQRMAFGKFVRRAAAGDDTLYLTTQEVAVAPDGHPELHAPPLSQLAADFPARPALAGSLVPQQVNMWMGAAPAGASSGLHHDFHDNLYVLLRGRKRFRLWPPADARRMYTHGRIATVHANGRIVYEGQGNILADGSDAGEVATWRRRCAAEQALADAESALQRGEAGARKRLRAAEHQLEAALDSELTAALNGGAAGVAPDAMADDYVDSEEEGAASDDSTGAGNANGHAARGGGGKEAQGGEPPSFSRVNLAMDDRQLRASFPLFPERASALTAELGAGQMLYLPAGWFHEVTSYGGGATEKDAKGCHLALNYWFHPPDNLDPGPLGFRHPYTRGYWPALWEARQAGGAGGAEAATVDAGDGGEGDEEQRTVGSSRRASRAEGPTVEDDEGAPSGEEGEASSDNDDEEGADASQEEAGGASSDEDGEDSEGDWEVPRRPQGAGSRAAGTAGAAANGHDRSAAQAAEQNGVPVTHQARTAKKRRAGGGSAGDESAEKPDGALVPSCGCPHDHSSEGSAPQHAHLSKPLEEYTPEELQRLMDSAIDATAQRRPFLGVRAAGPLLFGMGRRQHLRLLMSGNPFGRGSRL